MQAIREVCWELIAQDWPSCIPDLLASRSSRFQLLMGILCPFGRVMKNTWPGPTDGNHRIALCGCPGQDQATFRNPNLLNYHSAICFGAQQLLKPIKVLKKTKKEKSIKTCPIHPLKLILQAFDDPTASIVREPQLQN